MNEQQEFFSAKQNLVTENEKINALDELFTQSAKYQKSAEFLELLKFINRFRNLSPFNAFLIHMQDSGASIVLTPSKWKEYGRRVKPLSRPFIILQPFGPVAFVYNISDTEQIKDGEDSVPATLLNPFKTLGQLGPKVFQTTWENANKDDITYAEESMQMGGAGYATFQESGKFKVKVNSSYNLNEKYSTLVHELAHIYCGHLGAIKNSLWKERAGLTVDIKEIEAESVTFLVCKRQGLITTSIEYLSNYIKNEKPLPNISIETILTVAHQIEKMGLSGYKTKSKSKI